MSLGTILGQDRALRRLRALLASRRLPPALLLCGPPGVGKALAARAFAKALRCDAPAAGGDSCGACAACAAVEKGIDPDLSVVDSAYQAGLLEEEAAKQRSIKVDTVRHLVEGLQLRSLRGGWKVAVVEDAHTLVPEAGNAMLKALEEPPPKTLWVLVTHQPERLLPTVRSRCQAVPFGPLPPSLLERMLGERGAAPEEARELSRRSQGSLGRALALREGPAPDPESWLADPLAPFRLAEELPRELHLSRPAAEAQISRMAWHLRASRGAALYADAAGREGLRELASLRHALQSNADPRLTLELAAMAVQSVFAARPS